MAFRDVAGRVTLVTGAARGIGRAIAEAFVAEGAPVALCDIDTDGVLEAAEALGQKGTRVGAWALDVTDPDAFEEVVQRVEHDLGPIDVLVNNAGIMPLGSFHELSLATDHKQVDVNLFGVVHGMRAVLPRMAHRRRGHVVNIASGAGKVGIPHAAMYCATKHAVVGLTEAVRAEWLDQGIDFSYVMPLLVDTELISGAGRLRLFPLVTCEDVADATLGAVRKGQVDVFVPRSARIAQVLPALLPRPVYERLGRLFHLDRIFANLDHGARAAYHARALG